MHARYCTANVDSANRSINPQVVDLMTDTQHSTRHLFDWGFLSVECESFHTVRFPIQIHGSEAGVISVEY